MMKMKITAKNIFLLLLIAPVCIPVFGQQQKKAAYKTRKEVKYNKDTENKNVMQISENKIIFIRDVVKSYVDFKDDISDQSVINEIYDKIEKEFPIQLKGQPDNRTIQEIRKAALEEIRKDKNFSMEEDEYRKMLTEKAAKIYTNYKPGQKITLIYTKGNRRYRVQDTFYRFNGRSVSMGLRSIPYYDLIEEDKIKINPAYAQKKRDEYVKTQLADYLERRRDALLSKEVELEKKQLEDNIKNGFVRYAEMWRYPIQVINIRLIESIESDPRFAGKVTGLNLDSIHRIQIKRKDAVDKNELEERIRLHKEDAARRVGSIDTEQGFLNTVFWGFTRDEIKFVLESHGLNLVAGKEYDKVSSSDQQIKENRLYYEKNRLVKVVSVYNINNFETLTRLKANMLQKYGPDDQTKKKEFVRPGDPLTWTGIITDGHLHVKQNPQTGALEGQIYMTMKVVPLSVRHKRAELMRKGK